MRDEERKDECVGVGRVGVGEGDSVCEEGREKGQKRRIEVSRQSPLQTRHSSQIERSLPL